MGVLSALVFLVVALVGFRAESGLRTAEMSRIELTLRQRASLVRELTRGIAFQPDSMGRLDAIADRAAAAAGVRVTLIAPGGAVLGDSDVGLGRLPSVANHEDRPEIRAALQGSVGSSTRRSETVGRRLLYLAIPVDAGAGGVVRVAMDLSDLEAAVANLRRELLAAGAVGLVVAFGLSYALSWLTLRPIREMRQVLASVLRGDYRTRMSQGSDELGEISSAINELAEQLRERLHEITTEREQLRAVLNGMVEGVLVTDAVGRIILANDRFREFYGAWGDVVGRSVLEAIRDAELDEIMGEAGRGDDPVSSEIVVGRGGARTLRVHVVRFPARAGARMGSVAVFHDVSELARLERVRRDFVANASHELRTPLAAIRGYSETLLSGNDLSEADRRSYIEIIDRHSRRLGNLVGDLLELSKIESREVNLEFATVDVEALARRMVEDSRDRFAKQELTVKVWAEGPVQAWADSQAVEQILTNLLDNAVKYTEPQGRIRVGIEGDDNWVRVRVSDTGIGIPVGDRDRIFERFYRVDQARSRALGGTGLGLAIVRHLVGSLGGQISVESELGVGTTFTVRIPRAKGPRAGS
jgi:two-component system phosphate regulon sensor histidine kinase PhoR